LGGDIVVLPTTGEQEGLFVRDSWNWQELLSKDDVLCYASTKMKEV